MDDVIIDTFEPADGTVQVIGTNVYRDGEMIAFITNIDTFYMDMDLEPGYYDYCVAKVFSKDEGLHTWTSCEGSSCVLDVLVPEDCIAPENLTAEDLLGDGYTATLNWDAPNLFEPIWLQYDDGVNVDAIGLTAGGTMDIAAKWDPEQLVDFEGTSISMVKFFAGDDQNAAFILKIYQGENGDVIYEQPISSLNWSDWNEIFLDTPVSIDITQSIWVGYEVTHGPSTYPVGVANANTNPNSDLVSFDGETWDHIQNYMPYSWNLAAYVISSKGQYIQLPVISKGYDSVAQNAEGMFAASGISNHNVDPNFSSKEMMSYNIYRNGELIAEDVVETTYADEIGEADYVCYEVTAIYSVCGESMASNEACVDVALGMNSLENKIIVYPNPANDFVMIESSKDIRSIEISNYMGQVVNSVKAIEMTTYRINTSALSSGVYFVKVETADGVDEVRIVISE